MDRNAKASVATAVISAILLTAVFPAIDAALSAIRNDFTFTDIGMNPAGYLFLGYIVPVLFGLVLGATLILLCFFSFKAEGHLGATGFVVGTLVSLVCMVVLLAFSLSGSYFFGTYVYNFSLPSIALCAFLFGLITVNLLNRAQRD